MRTQEQILSDAIRSMTTAERTELSEILAAFNVPNPFVGDGLTRYVNRNALAHWRTKPKPKTSSRTKPGGYPKPKGNVMSPEMKASMQRSMKAAEERILAKRAANAASVFNLQLDHYSGEPIVIKPATYGLSLEETGAIRRPIAAKALEEYARSNENLRRGGTSLADYVQTAHWDEDQGDLSPSLTSACQKLQRHFGGVADLTQGGLLAV